MAQTFSHRLALALRLINSATGLPISYAGAALYADNKALRPIAKEDGLVILLDDGEKNNDFTLALSVPGYEPKTVKVDFSKIDKRLPIMDIHLLPNENCKSPFKFHNLDGFLPGITAVDAVRASDSPCLIREWDQRKKLLTVFNPHRLNLDRAWYALVDPNKETYEVFGIVSRISNTVFKIDRPLNTEFKNYFPICPVILGETAESGSYKLRLPDDSSHPQWIVRKVCGEKVTFDTIDPTAKPPPDKFFGGDG